MNASEPKSDDQNKHNRDRRTQEERLEALRERLYSRRGAVPPRERRRLSPNGTESRIVRESWENNEENRSEGTKEENTAKRQATQSFLQQKVSDIQNHVSAARKSVEAKLAESTRNQATTRASHAVSTPAAASDEPESHIDLTMNTKITKRRSKIRKYLIGAAVLFFTIAVILSSAMLFFGQNQISGDNISIDVEGPFVLGGGEELNLQIAVANQNAVPVESATLIIEYPAGTQSAEEQGKELFRERKALEAIRSGEVLNIPVKAVVFGEENEGKEVRVSVEYRVRGSNATFYKDAEPLRFKISSSPVAISVDALKQVSSGQEVELTVLVSSNSPTPLKNLLVEAEYPFGFDFTESSDAPISGQNVWSIDTLEPETEYEITVKGILVGDESGERVFDFRVGVPNERDAFNLASVFSVARAEMFIEEAFINLDVRIENKRDAIVAAPRDEGVDVSVSFTNTLSSTIYDAELSVELSGNALDEERVFPQQGFYDSNNNTVSWTSREVSSLREVAPGETIDYSFRLEAADGSMRTPQVDFVVRARGKRVSEAQVPEALTDTVSRAVKFESDVSVESYSVYSVGPFTNTGPIQPVAEEISLYTIIFAVENGSNEITDAEMSATLPSYVTWLDLVSAGDDVSYNVSTRELTWNIGDVDARADEEVAFQVSILPSQSQIGSIPTLVNKQQFRATDRFTGTVLRGEANALSTRLLEDPDEDGHKGTVLAN